MSASASEPPSWKESDSLSPEIIKRLANSDARPSVPPRRSRRSGWLAGLVLGALVGLWAFPEVRYTLGAQLQFALAESSVPWMRALDSRRSLQEAPRLNAAAAAIPNASDYLLQVGRATALANVGRDPYAPPSNSEDTPDHTLMRLGLVIRDFPDAPGAYAHLARYMMNARVRIQREEITSPVPSSPGSDASRVASSAPMEMFPVIPASSSQPQPPRRKDIRLMEWALRSGEARDPNNAFWPAMLATTYFAARRDNEALEALARTRRKMRWDAYLYEEVLGQWRLYSAAYGDHGAAQKIGPLSLLAFPHQREIRRMAEVACWRADRAAAAGRGTEAIRIRHEVATLGVKMRENARWAYEALFGTDLLLLSGMPSEAHTLSYSVRSLQDWEKASEGYLGLLKERNREGELAWLGREMTTSLELRQRVNVARYDASYPGTPPGIPLIPLFGNWMAGVCLLQQALTLLGTALLAALWSRGVARGGSLPHWARSVGMTLLVGMMGVTGAMVVSGLPASRPALAFLACVTVFLLLLWERKKQETRASAEAEILWTTQTTLRMLLCLVLPMMAALVALRPALSGLHPVAALLTYQMGFASSITIVEMLKLAFLASAAPIVLALAAAAWARSQGFSPLTGARIGLRRLALPALACLTVAYLLLLNQTLRLDKAASRAILAAAENDLQWVLTHSSALPTE